MPYQIFEFLPIFNIFIMKIFGWYNLTFHSLGVSYSDLWPMIFTFFLRKQQMTLDFRKCSSFKEVTLAFELQIPFSYYHFIVMLDSVSLFVHI